MCQLWGLPARERQRLGPRPAAFDQYHVGGCPAVRILALANDRQILSAAFRSRMGIRGAGRDDDDLLVRRRPKNARSACLVYWQFRRTSAPGRPKATEQ